MSTRSRLAGFAAVVALAMGAGAALGAAVGPLSTDDDEPAPSVDEHDGDHP